MPMVAGQEGMVPAQPHGFFGPLISPTQLMDMEDLKKKIKKLANEDVYYQVIDMMRPETPHFQRSVTAAHQYIIAGPYNPSLKKPDIKGFLIALFGLEEFQKMAKK